VVYEPFGGSGSTLIAAERLGAKARVVEVDPRYADVICRRWQEHSDDRPRLAATGQAEDFTA
jgi:DNA modification methylase